MAAKMWPTGNLLGSRGLLEPSWDLGKKKKQKHLASQKLLTFNTEILMKIMFVFFPSKKADLISEVSE